MVRSTRLQLDPDLRTDAVGSTTIIDAVTQSPTRPGPPRPGAVEHAGEQRADDAADTVHAEHVQRVVRAEQLLQAVDTPQRQAKPAMKPITRRP
jgi:hypothetical protein